MEIDLILFICWFVSLTIVASFFTYADIKPSFYSVIVAAFPIINTLAAIVFTVSICKQHRLSPLKKFITELHKRGLLYKSKRNNNDKSSEYHKGNMTQFEKYMIFDQHGFTEDEWYDLSFEARNELLNDFNGILEAAKKQLESNIGREYYEKLPKKAHTL